MRMNILTEALILKKMQKEFQDSTGRSIPYYQIVLDQNDEVETFGCNQVVYETATVGKSLKLSAVLDTSNSKAKVKFTGVIDDKISK